MTPRMDKRHFRWLLVAGVFMAQFFSQGQNWAFGIFSNACMLRDEGSGAVFSLYSDFGSVSRSTPPRLLPTSNRLHDQYPRNRWPTTPVRPPRLPSRSILVSLRPLCRQNSRQPLRRIPGDRDVWRRRLDARVYHRVFFDVVLVDCAHTGVDDGVGEQCGLFSVDVFDFSLFWEA